MLALIISILIGLGVAYFALQNSAGATVKLFNYQIPGVPVYLIVIVSLLIGLFVAWVMSLLDSVSNAFILRGRDHAINEARAEIKILREKIHDLELEIARLKGERNEPFEVETKAQDTYHPSLWERIKSTFRARRYPQVA